jgi:hypothetical protein
MNEWISVKERLPKSFLSVLVFMPKEHPCPTVHEGFVSDDGIWVANRRMVTPEEITHWKPMPLPPAEYLEKYIKGGVDNG